MDQTGLAAEPQTAMRAPRSARGVAAGGGLAATGGQCHQSVLRQSYAHCRALHRQHGRSYYLATQLLPAAVRPHVHALYGFTRRTDDIVDGAGQVDRLDTLTRWIDSFWTRSATDDPVLPAIWDTIDTMRLDPGDFRLFFSSMASDLDQCRYETYDDLLSYMNGSAAAVGTLMLPILGVDAGVDLAAAREPARQLGLAFQLTNFIRDVAEDYQRSRIYLPQADMSKHGVTEADIAVATSARVSSPNLKTLIQYEIQRARRHYAGALAGIPMLAPASRRCVSAAFRVYGGILREVAAANYDVFARRAVVPTRRRLALTGLALLAPTRLEPPCA